MSSSMRAAVKEAANYFPTAIISGRSRDKAVAMVEFQLFPLCKIQLLRGGLLPVVHQGSSLMMMMNLREKQKPMKMQLPSDEVAPVQDAVLRVQQRIVMGVPDPKESTVLSRLIVASHQIGCLLGKGGAVITEIRKLSGAQVRILGKDQIPKGVPENYGMVQISGEFRAVQDALLQITFRLKQHLFRDKLPAMDPK